DPGVVPDRRYARAHIRSPRSAGTRRPRVRRRDRRTPRALDRWRRRGPRGHAARGGRAFASRRRSAGDAVTFQSIAPDVKLGRGVKIYQFVNLYGCEIGDESRIGTFVEIQKGAKAGPRVKLSSH